jgi:hypothetical protein
MNAGDVILAIVRGELDEDLAVIAEQIRTRQKSTVGQTFSVGDMVRFVNQVKPQYLAGAEGEVLSINGAGNVRLKLTKVLKPGRGRFAVGTITNAPASLLAPLVNYKREAEKIKERYA